MICIHVKKRSFWLTVVLAGDSSNSIVLLAAVTDPDLQTRGAGSSRPWDKGGRSPKKIFSVLRASFWSPGFATEQYLFSFFTKKEFRKTFFIYLGRFPFIRTGQPDHYRTSYFDNEIGFFQGFLLKNHLLPAHYYYCQLLVRMLTKMAAFSRLFVCFL